MSPANEAVLVDWIRRKVVVPVAHLAFAWECDIGTIRAEYERQELTLFELRGETWCLHWMTQESRDAVRALCLALGPIDAVAAKSFFFRTYTELRGRSPPMTIGRPDFALTLDFARQFGDEWRAVQLSSRTP